MGLMQSKGQSSILDEQFMPLKDFKKFVSNTAKSTYPAKFSFEPLLKILRSKENPLNSKVCHPSIVLLEELENYADRKEMSESMPWSKEEIQASMAMVFPIFFMGNQMGFISGIFDGPQKSSLQTREMEKLFESDEWEIKLNPHRVEKVADQNTILAGSIILERFYDHKFNVHSFQEISLRNTSTGLEKHFKLNLILDYIDVKAVSPVRPLNERQIHSLLNDMYNEKLWEELLPPDNFLFEGFVVGILEDVTRVKTLSTIKELMGVEGGKVDQMQLLNRLQRLLCSYLEIPDLRFGSLQHNDAPWVDSSTWSLLRKYDRPLVTASFSDRRGPYGKLLHGGKPVILEDLNGHQYLPPLEQKLRDQGFRSLLLAPMHDDEGNIISVFELASPQTFQFSELTLFQLEEIIPLLNAGSNRFIQETKNAIRLTVQQEFTSIHPSVEWKFNQVAGKFYWDQVIAAEQSSIDPIVFKDVYPLYGQADIVSSSRQRNESIRADLMDNLERLLQLLMSCRETVPFHLLEVYSVKLSSHLKRLQEGAFVSNDESLIVELLTGEIHPLIRSLSRRFPQLRDLVHEYFEYLDPELDIVYRRRKAYEQSVKDLNRLISYHLIQEEERMQKILPHYFEKFETDGVEYNLYVGQSLLEKDTFDNFYLRDFRLWQLILMCDITRLVERHSKELPVPLTTAQLIFVYSTSLSIRFLMDEKQFDVDGAYNVRYEILKKRIDKAYIKGTNERLTQSGKIAIVWLQEKDRLEYQEYLDYLVQKQYIKPEIELVDLEKMQGVEGLKAFRVEVLSDKR